MTPQEFVIAVFVATIIMQVLAVSESIKTRRDVENWIRLSKELRKTEAANEALRNALREEAFAKASGGVKSYGPRYMQRRQWGDDDDARARSRNLLQVEDYSVGPTPEEEETR